MLNSKVMTIEEKAKRYDEAIKKAESLYNAAEPMSGCNVLLETVFPELKESEDERIRKALIEMVKMVDKNPIHQLFGYGDITYSDMISWLEKQGEYTNFRNKIQIGDKVTRNRDGVLVNLSQLNRVAKKDERQGEQKPIDANEEDNDFTIYHPIKNEYSNKYECFPYSFYGSIEAFHNNEELLCFLRNCFYKKEDCEKWCREQNEQNLAWSEEVENEYVHILKTLNSVAEEQETKGYNNLISSVNWLKSLKDRYTWKPSDEQMEALKEACDKHWEPDGLDPLYTLYQDLKKLREE